MDEELAAWAADREEEEVVEVVARTRGGGRRGGAVCAPRWPHAPWLAECRGGLMSLAGRVSGWSMTRVDASEYPRPITDRACTPWSVVHRACTLWSVNDRACLPRLVDDRACSPRPVPDPTEASLGCLRPISGSWDRIDARQTSEEECFLRGRPPPATDEYGYPGQRPPLGESLPNEDTAT
ncbi:hypothetical protein Dimus_014304 [Dionaea muscipula]